MGQRILADFLEFYLVMLRTHCRQKYRFYVVRR